MIIKIEIDLGPNRDFISSADFADCLRDLAKEFNLTSDHQMRQFLTGDSFGGQSIHAKTIWCTVDDSDNVK